MRRIYLARHGKPDFPDGMQMCISRTDIGLGEEGRRQAFLLSQVPEIKNADYVFSSPLSRCVETASYLNPEPIIVDGLHELGVGDWEGLRFDEIKRRWPALYAARGGRNYIPIPGCENLHEGQQRFEHAVRGCLDRSCGNIVVVAHATANKTLLCSALGLPPEKYKEFKLHYGSYSVLDFDGKFHVVKLSVVPQSIAGDMQENRIR